MMIYLLTSCAAIPANKIKLEKYPEINGEIKDLDLSFIEEKSPKKLNEYHEFDDAVTQKLLKNLVQKKSEKSAPTKCLIEISTKNETNSDGMCEPYFAVTFFTLFTVPYYCQHTYEAHATLISHPKDSEISGAILPSISGAKPGDIFLDSDDQPAKILKTYELKDKVHEVWSLLWMLSWLVVEPNKYSSIQNKYLDVGRHPDVAKIDTENTLSEALTRSILHDASTFKECQKPQPSTSKKK